MTEKQLIEGCRNGERLAQKELYETYSRKMMGVCLRYVSDRETARDLLQDGFVKVFTSMDSYSGLGSFEGWMRKIFVNCALEYLRKSDVLREAVDLDNTEELVHPDSSAISDMSAVELMKLVQELPAGFRTVFNLFAIVLSFISFICNNSSYITIHSSTEWKEGINLLKALLRNSMITPMKFQRIFTFVVSKVDPRARGIRLQAERTTRTARALCKNPSEQRQSHQRSLRACRQ